MHIGDHQLLCHAANRFFKQQAADKLRQIDLSDGGD
jgi:hypothetical protein